MNKFRTEVDIAGYDPGISYRSKVLFMGSCFTNHIGGKMDELKFDVEINPFGITYNPMSLKQGLDILLESYVFTEKDLGFNNGLWYSFYHHSEFSNADKGLCIENINKRIREASEYLKETDFLFLSFGTARVYELKETGRVVSNCHKLPASLFKHNMLGAGEIEEHYAVLFDSLFKYNPKLKIILTLSPIRHWKDGAEGNQLSKATLMVAIHKLVDGYKSLEYFPSYEIMMDDLRDYRFYADDMIHVSDVAVDYIWRKFRNAFLDKEAQSLIRAIERILKAVGHRPFEPASQVHKDFLAGVLKKIEDIEKKHPVIDLAKEKLQVIRQL